MPFFPTVLSKIEALNTKKPGERRLPSLLALFFLKQERKMPSSSPSQFFTFYLKKIPRSSDPINTCDFIPHLPMQSQEEPSSLLARFLPLCKFADFLYGLGIGFALNNLLPGPSFQLLLRVLYSNRLQAFNEVR